MKYPILVPNIFNHPFTYESSLNLKVGDYVMVPFGKSKITGVVWDEFEKNNNKNFKTKNVIKKLDVTPLKKNTINFLNWFAEYNLIPKGMALKLVLLNNNVAENKATEQAVLDQVRGIIHQRRDEVRAAFKKEQNKF